MAAETDSEAKATRGDGLLEAGASRGRGAAVAATCGADVDESQSSVDGFSGLGCRSSLKPLSTEKEEAVLASMLLQRLLQLGRSPRAAAAATADGWRILEESD